MSIKKSTPRADDASRNGGQGEQWGEMALVAPFRADDDVIEVVCSKD